MNWENYLMEKKAPSSSAHLGVMVGTVKGVYDLTELPKDTRILNLVTPLKKTKLCYTNLAALSGNETIEGIKLTDIDKERLSVFSQMPNLKYLQISNNKQDEIPDLSCLSALEVLVLSSIMKVETLEFIQNMKSLKTLYIYGIKQMRELTPLSHLSSLRELWLDHGENNGTGTPIKSMEPLRDLTQLQFLYFNLNVENRNYDVSPLFNLKNLRVLNLLPRYYKNGQWERLKQELPLLTPNDYFPWFGKGQ